MSVTPGQFPTTAQMSDDENVQRALELMESNEPDPHTLIAAQNQCMRTMVIAYRALKGRFEILSKENEELKTKIQSLSREKKKLLVYLFVQKRLRDSK